MPQKTHIPLDTHGLLRSGQGRRVLNCGQHTAGSLHWSRLAMGPIAGQSTNAALTVDKQHSLPCAMAERPALQLAKAGGKLCVDLMSSLMVV
jgi:hypothetical protein